MIETEFIYIERAKLPALLDVAVSSMDFGSGFWDSEQAEAARWAAEVLGVCPNDCTPTNILMHFPPCEGTVRTIRPPYTGYDGRRYQQPPTLQHIDHDVPTPELNDWQRERREYYERWRDGEWRRES